jgi:hypothetical protein
MRPNVKRLILGSILTVVMASSVGCVYPGYYDRYDRSYYYSRYDRDYARRNDPYYYRRYDPYYAGRYDPDYRYSRSRYWNRWSSDRDWQRSHRWEHDQDG